MTLTISPARLTRLLLMVLSALILAHAAGQFSKHALGYGRLLGLIPAFDLDLEANVPTWASAVGLLLSAGLLGAIARAKRQAGAPYARHWAALALIFAALSVDEAASIHELASKPVREALGAGGIFRFAWVIPGGAFVLLVGLAYARFLLALPRATRRLFVAAAVLYVGGALGMEMAGGYIVERFGRTSAAYLVSATVEESLEMLGIVVFIHALTAYLGAEVGEVRLRFSSR